MSLAFLSLNGKYDKPLYTTGQAATTKEAVICTVGWLVVGILITTIILLIKHFKAKKSVKLKSEINDDDINNLATSIERNKFLKRFSYFLECMCLCFYPFYREENKVMHSTGAKPTKKEISICISGWVIIAALITAVVLICIYL